MLFVYILAYIVIGILWAGVLAYLSIDEQRRAGNLKTVASLKLYIGALAFNGLFWFASIPFAIIIRLFAWAVLRGAHAKINKVKRNG